MQILVHSLEKMYILIENNRGSHSLATNGSVLLYVELLFEFSLVFLRSLRTNSSLLKPLIYIPIKF